MAAVMHAPIHKEAHPLTNKQTNKQTKPVGRRSFADRSDPKRRKAIAASPFVAHRIKCVGAHRLDRFGLGDRE
jgi:hypothetical protein